MMLLFLSLLLPPQAPAPPQAPPVEEEAPAPLSYGWHPWEKGDTSHASLYCGGKEAGVYSFKTGKYHPFKRMDNGERVYGPACKSPWPVPKSWSEVAGARCRCGCVCEAGSCRCSPASRCCPDCPCLGAVSVFIAPARPAVAPPLPYPALALQAPVHAVYGVPKALPQAYPQPHWPQQWAAPMPHRPASFGGGRGGGC